jgi:hypothetical protein
MHELFVAIQQSSPSVWMREAPHAYFVALILHAWGMALLVGGGIVAGLRVLGVGGGAALERFRGFFPVMWLGAAMAIISGLALLVAYPAKALTNPVFALKLIFLVAAAVLTRKVLRGSRVTAAVALVLWLAVVAAGKLLLYTYSIEMVN